MQTCFISRLHCLNRSLTNPRGVIRALRLICALVLFFPLHSEAGDDGALAPLKAPFFRLNTAIADGNSALAKAATGPVFDALQSTSLTWKIYGYDLLFQQCLALYLAECIGAASKGYNDAAEIGIRDEKLPREVRLGYIAIANEHIIRLAVATNNTSMMRRALPSLKQAVASAFQGNDFARLNLTIAEAAARLGEIEEACFYARRGWLHFVSATTASPLRYMDLVDRYFQLFLSLGQNQRAISIYAIAEPKLRQLSNGHAFHEYRVARLKALFGWAVNRPDIIIGASEDALLAVRRANLDQQARQFFSGAILPDALIACFLSDEARCETATWSTELLEAVKQTTTPGAHTYFQRYAALAIALSNLQKHSNVDPLIRQILREPLPEGSGEWHESEQTVHLAGRYFLDVIENDVGRRDAIRRAAKQEMKRLRHFLTLQPFETAQIPLGSRALLSMAVLELSGPKDVRDDDVAFLLEVASLLNRTPRAVETQYVSSLVAARDPTERLAIQTLHLTEQALFRAEKKAFGRLVPLSWGQVPDSKARVDLPEPATWRGLVSLALSIKRLDPAYKKAGLAFAGEWNLLQNLQGVLSERERFITHVTVADRLFRFCISRSKARMESISFDPRGTLVSERLVEAALTSPAPPSEIEDAQFPIDAVRRLSELLVGRSDECLGSEDHLIFAIDPSIRAMPMHVLLDPEKEHAPSETAGLAALPWLGKTRAISMVVAPEQLISSRTLPVRRNYPVAFLGVGDPRLDGSMDDGLSRQKFVLRGVNADRRGGVASLDELPETRVELERIGAAFGSESTLLIGDSATEQMVRRQLLGNYRVIDFATHGLVREEIEGVTEPALVLTPTGPENEDESGILTATKISELPLSAQVVILSACNSARFDLDLFGPEAASLSTAFFLAGARATVASLWSVDSNATVDLMSRFADKLRLKRDQEAAFALNEAMQDFLAAHAGSPYSNPRFWAPFLVFGDDREATTSKSELKSRSLVELDRSGRDEYGEWNRAKRLTDDVIALAGIRDTGGRRVHGRLRGISSGRTLWTVEDPEWTFLLPKGLKDRETVWAVAWRVLDGRLSLQLRHFSLAGLLLATIPITETKGSGIYDALFSSRGDLLLLTYDKHDGLESMYLADVDVSGKLLAERPLPDLVDRTVWWAQLYQADGGLWVGSFGNDWERTGMFKVNDFGQPWPCNAFVSRLLRLDSDLHESSPVQKLLDLEVADITPLKDGRYAAAVTRFPGCESLDYSIAGAMLLESDGRTTSSFVPDDGLASRAEKVRELPSGGLAVIGHVRREVAPFVYVPPNLDSGGKRLEQAIREQMAIGRQHGGFTARFSETGKFTTEEMFFSGASLDFEDVVIQTEGSWFVIGENGYAPFSAVIQ